jgi:hypothetical protein
MIEVNVDVTQLEERLIKIESALGTLRFELDGLNDRLNKSVPNWNAAHSTVVSNSADWSYHFDHSEVASLSANWNNTHLTVSTCKPSWDYSFDHSEIAAMSGDWDATSATVSAYGDYWTDSVGVLQSTATYLQSAVSHAQDAICVLQKEELDTHRSIWRSLADTFKGITTKEPKEEQLLIEQTPHETGIAPIMDGGTPTKVHGTLRETTIVIDDEDSDSR